MNGEKASCAFLAFQCMISCSVVKLSSKEIYTRENFYLIFLLKQNKVKKSISKKPPSCLVRFTSLTSDRYQRSARELSFQVFSHFVPIMKLFADSPVTWSSSSQAAFLELAKKRNHDARQCKTSNHKAGSVVKSENYSLAIQFSLRLR
jgi:hypothetical protein